MSENNFSGYKVNDEIVVAFVKAVDDEAFVLADIADQIGIGQQEAIAVLNHIIEHDILRLKCIWVPEKKYP